MNSLILLFLLSVGARQDGIAMLIISRSAGVERHVDAGDC